jgi:hypothetical protein
MNRKSLVPIVTAAIACVAFILWQANLTQSAARTLDGGIRPLGGTKTEGQAGPVYIENDSYYWLMMAERMATEGTARIRHTATDNAPFGRPVFWSQSIAWMMHGLAKLPPFSSQPDPLVAASFWVNPVLQSLVVLALAWILSPLGWPATIAVLVLFVCLGDVSWAFSSLRPDHQSLQAAFSILMLALLLRAGFGFGSPAAALPGSEKKGNRSERWPFVAAGIFSGAGLWVSSAAMMPILMLLTAAVCATALVFGSFSPESSRHARTGWLLWGTSAFLTSLAFWLLEFFPDWKMVRLEVNNPLFAVWALGLGTGMSLAFGCREGLRMRWGGFAALAVVAAGCALLPGTILFGPVEWYWPRDLTMDRVHNFIMEFYTLQNFTKGAMVPYLARVYLLVVPLGFLLLVPAWLQRRSAGGPVFLVLMLVFLGLFAMGMRQIRWFGLFSPVAALAAGVASAWLVGLVWKRGEIGKVLAVGLGIVLVGQGFFLASDQIRNLQSVAAGRSVLNELMPSVLNKQFALLVAAEKDRPAVVLADPDLAPALQYFAKVPVVVSFYWENVEGARDAMRFFADTGEEDALEVAKRRGITHVIVPSGSIFPNYFDFMKHGHYNTARASTTLAAKLTRSSDLPPPRWLETDYQLDRLGKMPFTYKGETIEQYLNIYRVAP